MNEPIYILTPKETDDKNIIRFDVTKVPLVDYSLKTSYWYNVGVSLDQTVNAFLGGSADETLSARAHRMRVKKQKYWWWVADVIDFILFFDKHHCETSYLAELQRKHLPSEYLKSVTNSTT